MRSSLRLLFAVAALGGTAWGAEASSPEADALRGGWVTDVGGVRHIIILKVRDDAVSGIYCAVDCGDPSRLVFIDHGRLTADGVRFQMLRVEGSRESRADVTGTVKDGHLSLTLKSLHGAPIGPRSLELQRDPRKPADVTVEELFARRGVKSGPLLISATPTPYVPAGPNEPITAEAIEGLWVWSTGPGKQHFMFRRVGKGVLGAVCGPCDNPYTFGVLDAFAFRGDSLTFDINHEDWGIGIEYGPFANHATVTLSRHELHLHTVAQNGSRTVEGDLPLSGPIRTVPPR